MNFSVCFGVCYLFVVFVFRTVEWRFVFGWQKKNE